MLKTWAVLGLLLLALSCAASVWANTPRESHPGTSLPMSNPSSSTVNPATATKARVLVVGDSLSAEYGLPRGTGWVALLTQRVDGQGIAVINASISGDTTSGALSRLPAALKTHRPTHVVIELGSNDALRGLSLQATQANLVRLVRLSKEAGSKVLLAGMMVPPNFGQRYTADFARMFGVVAQAEGTSLVPFFLKGVADRPDSRDWFQADGLHPLAKAHPQILENVWAALSPMLPMSGTKAAQRRAQPQADPS